MEKLDYKRIGLKSGIEIHQRLDTDKLFCSCPSMLRDDKPDIVIRRELRAVSGETGEVDVAAAHEKEKGTYFIYEAYSDTTCLVELDEEPPHPMNQEALRVVLQVCKMLNMHVVDEIQVMRKTVVNGSNTSGFQRTALVGRQGWFEIDGKKIGVPTVMIEEEACKDIEKGTDKDGRRYVVFRVDRLGIPLIEIGTDPDMNTPEEVKEASEKIGMILRSTGKAARGIGTIRQDLNVSVTGGHRVEIKGAQELKMIPTWVEYEARRQLALIELASLLKEKRPRFEESRSADVTSVFKETSCGFVKKAVDSGSQALAFTIPCFSGLLGKETQPGKRVGSELSDYAKMKTGIGGMIHSDEDMSKYTFKQSEISQVRKALNLKDGEAFVIIVTDADRARRAMGHVIDRAKACLDGVPGEVRKPNPDGTSSYMRPMPGAARMYPETDVKPIRPDLRGIELPELLTEMKDRFKQKYGLAEDLARDLSRSGKHSTFEEFVTRFSHVKPAFIAETMISTPKILRRKYNVDETRLTDADMEKIFSLLDSGELTKDPVEEILVSICKGDKVDYSRYRPMSDTELETEIKKILDENSQLPPNAVIGKVMGALKGKADGRKIMDLLKNVQGIKK